MTTPIPLTDPEGRVWAYLCSTCKHVRTGGERLVEHTEPDPQLEGDAFRAAERCCRCRKCGARAPWMRRPERPTLFFFHNDLCEACAATQAADEPRRHAEAEVARNVARDAFEASIAKAKDRDAAILLRNLMSDASEEVMCAGWLTSLEFELWEVLQAPDCKSEWSPYMPEIQRLSEKAGGWWYWAGVGDGTELFATLEEWQGRYDAHVATRLLNTIITDTAEPPPIDADKVCSNLKKEVDRIVGSLTPAEKAIMEKRFPGERWDSSGGYEIVPGSPTWCAVTAWLKDTCVKPTALIPLKKCDEEKP